MQASPLWRRRQTNDRYFADIAHVDRRRCLEMLRRCSTEMPVPVLATMLAAASTNDSPIVVSEDEQQRRHVRLVHDHLPRLDDAGLLEWDRDADVVRPVDHPLVQDPAFQQLLAVTTSDVDPVLSALADPIRRLALPVLHAAEDDAIGRRALVRRTLARASETDPAELPGDVVEEGLVAFHHVHLPALERVGLVEYDGDEVCYRGHPTVDDELLGQLTGELAGDVTRQFAESAG
jgi:hypothetical protein